MQTIIILLTIMFGCQLWAFWYFREYLRDIHDHVFEAQANEQQNMFQSFVEGYKEDVAEPKSRKVKKKKDAE